MEKIIKIYTNKEDYAKDLKELVYSGKYIIENEIGFNTSEHGQENQVEYKPVSIIKIYKNIKEYDIDVIELATEGYSIEHEMILDNKILQVEYKLDNMNNDVKSRRTRNKPGRDMCAKIIDANMKLEGVYSEAPLNTISNF